MVRFGAHPRSWRPGWGLPWRCGVPPHLRPRAGGGGFGDELGGPGSRAGGAQGGTRGGRPLPGGRGGVSGAGFAAQGGPGERRRGCRLPGLGQGWECPLHPGILKPLGVAGPPPPPPGPGPVLTPAGQRRRGSGSASGRRRRSASTEARPCRPRTPRTSRRAPGPADGPRRGDQGPGRGARPRDPSGRGARGGGRVRGFGIQA